MRKKYSSSKMDNVIFLIVSTVIVFITILWEMHSPCCTGLFFLNPLHEQNLHRDKPPLLTCIYCKGTGERLEDVNKLMFMAKVQFYFNKHMMVDKCEKCVKLSNSEYYYCDKMKEQHDSFFKDYEKEGVKFEKTMCGKCMGSGRFQILTKNPKTNQWYTQEDYEEDERAKTNE